MKAWKTHTDMFKLDKEVLIDPGNYRLEMHYGREQLIKDKKPHSFVPSLAKVVEKSNSLV